MKLVKTSTALIRLQEQAETLPPELRGFGMAVVQALAQLYGLISVKQMAERLKDTVD